jgi:multimeric flavodoxin WrbA
MRALIFDGSRQQDSALADIRRLLTEELSDNGIEVDVRSLRDVNLAPCLGCFRCWTDTPGICVIDDEARNLAKSAIQSDVLVYLTPITFGGYSSELKKAVDRIICLVLPFFKKVNGEVHHHRRYASYPRLLAIGTTSPEDTESVSIFKTLVSRNAINLHCPGHGALALLEETSEGETRAGIKSLLSDAGVKI